MTSPTGNLAWQEALQQEEEIRPAPLVTGDAEAGPSTPRKTASRGQKAVAAIAGAVTTSLLSECVVRVGCALVSRRFLGS